MQCRRDVNGSLKPNAPCDDQPSIYRPGIESRYQLIERIGQGASSELFRCYDHREGRTIALKRMHDRHTNRDADRDHFLAEPRRMRNWTGGLVPAIYDIYPERMSKPYFTMQLIEGTDLCGILRQLIAKDPATSKRFPLTQRVSLIQQIAAGLDEVHRSGFVHRDIKPENIMVDHCNRPKLIDWGIAIETSENKHRDDPVPSDLAMQHGASPLPPDRRASPAKTMAIGTPRYMSPEQIQSSDHVGPAADVFSLGAVLHDCLTLTPLIPGRSVREIFRNTVQGAFDVSLTCSVSDRDALERILEDAVAIRPRDRYRSIRQFASDLNAWLVARKRPLHVAIARGNQLATATAANSFAAAPF